MDPVPIMHLALQSLFQKLRCIPLYFDIFKLVRELIATAPAVAVDASVSTSAVYIQTVVSALVMKYSLCLNKMHILRFFLFPVLNDTPKTGHRSTKLNYLTDHYP